MSVLFDNLTAAIITSIVLLTLVGLQIRGQRGAIEGTVMYTAKKQILSLAEVLEEDLTNLGYKRNPMYQPDRILEFEFGEENGVDYTKCMVFWGLVRSTSGSASSALIGYEVKPVGTTIVSGNVRPLFKWQRYELPPGGSGADCSHPGGWTGDWNKSGGSFPTLTRFRVDLAKGGNPLIAASTLGSLSPLQVEQAKKDAREVKVAISSAVSPESNRSYQRVLHWQARVRPAGLREKASSL